MLKKHWKFYREGVILCLKQMEIKKARQKVKLAKDDDGFTTIEIDEGEILIYRDEVETKVATLEGEEVRKVEGWIVEQAVHYPGSRWEPPEDDYKIVVQAENFWKVLEYLMDDIHAVRVNNLGEYFNYLEDEHFYEPLPEF